MKESCPDCHSNSGVREFSYGLPDGPYDESKFVSGGCCISEHDPTLRCIDCGWEGEYRSNMPYQDKTIKVAELKPLADMTDAEIDDYAKHVWNKLTNGEKGSSNGYSTS